MSNTVFIEVNGKSVRRLERHKTNPDYHTVKQQVFIIGCKGIPAAYGGFETFAEKLTECQTSEKIRYHVARIAEDNLRYEYNDAKCFDVKVPDIGAAKAIVYDIASLRYSIEYCQQRPSIKRPIFYVLACRIGPFIGFYKKKIEKLGGLLYVNPDGHEWKRAKWSAPVRKYWKFSESGMVKHADLLICDSKNIEKYIKEEYERYNPKTTFIAYGADTVPSKLGEDDPAFLNWMSEKGLEAKGYYLIVGRFVPENSFETMIREFMKSNSGRDLAIITTSNEALLNQLEEKLHFMKDKRIKFVGTVYDQELLKKIRENAYGYLHGHTVGGTNPSLLEALGSTDLNLLVGVGFNQEVAEDGALYWSQEPGSLAKLIDRADAMTTEQIADMGRKARERVKDEYSWEKICKMYEDLFSKEDDK